MSGYTADTNNYNNSDATEEAPICETYTYDLIKANALSNVVSYSIVAVNFILRLFIIKLI